MVTETKTPEEKQYHADVAALGCIIRNKDCAGKLEVHHKTGAGMGLRASHFDVMPLCFNHHSAQTRLPFGHAVHKGTKTFEKIYGTQDHLIEQTRFMVMANSF